MNNTWTQSAERKPVKLKRFGLLLAAAVILYVAAIMVFIVVY